MTRMSRFCNLSNVVAFGHNKLWRPQVENNLSMPLKCCDLQPQRTVVAKSCKSKFYKVFPGQSGPLYSGIQQRVRLRDRWVPGSSHQLLLCAPRDIHLRGLLRFSSNHISVTKKNIAMIFISFLGLNLLKITFAYFSLFLL